MPGRLRFNPSFSGILARGISLRTNGTSSMSLNPSFTGIPVLWSQEVLLLKLQERGLNPSSNGIPSRAKQGEMNKSEAN